MLPGPRLGKAGQGIRRTHGTAQHKATPLRTSAIRDLLDTCGITRLIDRLEEERLGASCFG